MTEGESRRSRHRNGEGSVYRRKSDGLWVGATYVLTSASVYKRKIVYGSSWEEARAKLTQLFARSEQGIPVPDRSTRMRDYLDYWLAAYVAELRPTTARGTRASSGCT